MASRIASKSGLWNYTGSWSASTLPTSSDGVVISGCTLVVDAMQSAAVCSSLKCSNSGILAFQGNKSFVTVASNKIRGGAITEVESGTLGLAAVPVGSAR